MLFVSVEKSRQTSIITFFKDLYDGSPKEYPQGSMRIFLPIADASHITPEYRAKIILNHDKLNGDEAAVCIGGLKPLKSEITLKNGSAVTLQALLKRFPACPGMSTALLFQPVEPNATGVVAMAVYQKVDQLYVEKRKLTLEHEIRQVIADGCEHKAHSALEGTQQET
jgi:hypothetical protein